MKSFKSQSERPNFRVIAAVRVFLFFAIAIGFWGQFAEAEAAERRCSGKPKLKFEYDNRQTRWVKGADIKPPAVGLYFGGYRGSFYSNCGQILVRVTQFNEIRIKKGEEGNSCVIGHEKRHKKIADGFPAEFKSLLRRAVRSRMTMKEIDAVVADAYESAKQAIRKKQKKFDSHYGYMDTNNCRYAARKRSKLRVYKK